MSVPAEQAGSLTCRTFAIEIGMVKTEVIQNEVEITAVGFEVDVKQVPDERNAPGRRIETDIDQHPKKLVIRHAKPPGLIDDVETDRSPGEVTNTREQPDDRICPERKACSGNAQRGVHEQSQPTHAAKADQTVNVAETRVWAMRSVVCHAAVFITLLRRLIAYSPLPGAVLCDEEPENPWPSSSLSRQVDAARDLNKDKATDCRFVPWAGQEGHRPGIRNLALSN